MKKGILKSLAVMMLMVMCVPQIFALPQIRVRVNGTQVYFPDGQPYVDSNSRVLVPVRFVSEQLGAKVDWDQAAKRVTILDGDKEAILHINSKKIMVNGTAKELDTAAIVKGTRTYVPLRFVSEALGATVKWDGKVRIVYIDNGKAPLPEVKVLQMGPFTVPVTSGCIVSSMEVGHVIIDTENQLMIREETYQGTKYIDFTLSTEKRTGYTLICDEAEQYLRQIISDIKAKEIIDFTRTKKDGTYKIGDKTYNVDGYRIVVCDQIGATCIKVFTK